jgi:hypothetical protein
VPPRDPRHAGVRRHQMTIIASWFNYINRVADALGVGRD